MLPVLNEFMHNAIKKNGSLLGLLLLLQIPIQTDAQKHRWSFDELTNKAEQKEELGDFYGAIAWYRKALEKSEATKISPEQHFNVVNRLADLNRTIRNYPVAANYYKQLYSGRSSEYPQARFYLGLMLQQTGQYDSALKVMKAVNKHYQGPNKRVVKKRTEVAIKGCKKALKRNAADDKRKTSINHLNADINSAYTELSPTFKGDSTLLYASRKADSIIEVQRGQKVASKTRFYIAQKQASGWQHQGPWKPFNDESYNVGNGSFSPNGEYFYFTRCQLNNNKKMRCKLYVSQKKDDNQWAKPEELPNPINKAGISSTHPSLGTMKKGRREKTIIFFTSNREGGKGGKDIWYTSYDKRRDQYANPRNAGRKVNTLGDEVTPYFDDKLGRLYFSSNGHPGYGGLDVFRVPFEGGRTRAKPKNLGEPVNSPADDLYYTKNPQGEGFLVSNRNGVIALKHPTCCDDIFALQMPKEYVKTISGVITLRQRNGDDTSITTNGEETVRDTGRSVVSIYENEITDSGGKRTLIAQDTLTKEDSGQYQFNLEEQEGEDSLSLTVNKESYYREDSDTFTRKELTEKGNHRDLSLKPIPKEPIVIPNIYYAFDKAKLKPQSKPVLDTTLLSLLENNPKLILEIRSHTDSVGSNRYNQELSQERAQSVVDYLVDKGVDRKRLKAKGFGESKPIAPNTNPDGSDNPEGRQKNRRTEFRVIGEIKGNKEITYTE